MQGLKRMLDEKKKNNIIWAYRTTPRTSTGEMSFRLTYRMDAIIPVEIGSSSYRVSRKLDPDINNLNARICLDLLEEWRERASIVLEAHRQKVAGYHNKHVRPTQFKVKDLVLIRADISKGNSRIGMLEPNWEGSYQVIKNLLRVHIR